MPQAIVYVSCSKGNAIEVLGLDRATGALSRIETAELPGNGMPLAVAPDRRHLYAAVASNGEQGGPQYVTFSIEGESGRLRRQAMIDAPGRMSHIWVERSGHFLLGASVANDLISAHSIAADGAINAEAAWLRTVPSKAHHITTDLGNRFAFVPNLGADLVMQLCFDVETGSFSDNSPAEVRLPEGAAPRHIAHHPGGRWLYLLCEEDGAIVVFEISEGGTLTAVQRSDFLPEAFDGKAWGAQILVTPDGRHLYASERTSSTISHHSIDPVTGLLSKGRSTPTEACPRNFAIDPTSAWLIVAGERSNRVACYAIDGASGALDHASDIDSAAGPLWIEVL